MSTWVFYYALNSKQGKDELYDDLTSATKYPRSFADFIAEQTAKWGNSFTVTYQQVIDSVKNRFEDLLPSHLSAIERWYDDLLCNHSPGSELQWKEFDEALATLLRRCGIETLFEITNASASCHGFIFQYGNFEDEYELDAFNEDDEGSNIKREDFIHFLDYMILLMCRLRDANLYNQFDYSDLSEDHQKEIKRIMANYHNDTKIQELLNRELNYIKEHWIEHHQNDGPSDPEVQTVYDHYRFLIACLEMKATLKEEYTRVLMINA
jgi:hypothetical protein